MPRRKKMLNEAAYIAMQTHVPVLLMGEPGCGKTMEVESLYRTLGLHGETLILSQMDAAEVGGWPYPVDHSGGHKVMTFLPTAWGQRIIDAYNKGQNPSLDGVIFADELTSCPLDNQAAFLRIVSQLKSGEMTLPPRTRIWAAANPADCAVNPHDLAPPMANRFFWYDWKIDTEAWCDGLVSGFPDQDIVRLPKDWSDEHLKAKVEISVYISRHSTALQMLPKAEVDASGPWPSKRSWTYAAELLGAAESVGASRGTIKELIVGCVGIGAYETFDTYISGIKLPDIGKILEDPDALDLSDKDLTPDLMHMILVEVATHAARSGDQEKRMAAWTFLGRVSEKAGADVVCAAMQILSKVTIDSDIKKLGGMKSLKSFKDLQKMVNALSEKEKTSA